MNPATVRMPSYGFYARDAWQATRKLTIDYGIRYEIYPAPRRDHWAGERYDPNTDKVYRGGFDTGIGQLAPRLGFAYRVERQDRDSRWAAASASTPTPSATCVTIIRPPFPRSTPAPPVTCAAGTLRTGIPDVVGPDLNQTVFTLPGGRGHHHLPAGLQPRLHRILERHRTARSRGRASMFRPAMSAAAPSARR